MEENLKTFQVKRKPYNILIGIFVFAILAIFPLFYLDYYYNILQAKYYFYCVSVIVMIITVTLSCIYVCCRDQTMWLNLKKRLKYFSLPEIFMAVFLLINIISTIQSDYVYESFWGNEGRYTGLFLWLLYGFSFFFVVKLFDLKKWYLDAFLLAGILAGLFGITDYFQLNLLGFKTNMNPGQLNMFVSTIGNVNTYTAYIALVAGISAVMYVTAKTWSRIIWYYTCMVISFFAIIMGLSDNAYLALGALFGFLPLYLFRTRSGIRRYTFMLATFSAVIWSIDLINKIMPDKVMEMGGALQAISGVGCLEIIVIALFVLSGILFITGYTCKKQEDRVGRWLVFSWVILIVCVIVFVIYLLFDANFGGHADRYGGLSNYLIFNDDWGTHRGYNWRIGMEAYRNFPLLHKIFGYGPDTYGILSVYGGYYEEMKMRYEEVYDSAHNEYLQFFITVGPFGMMAYIGLLISSFIRMSKRALDNECVMAIMFAVVCYAVQAMVNINLPISTPIMMTLLMMGLSACRDEWDIGVVHE